MQKHGVSCSNTITTTTQNLTYIVDVHSDIIMPSSGVVQACSDVVMISLTLWLARVH